MRIDDSGARLWQRQKQGIRGGRRRWKDKSRIDLILVEEVRILDLRFEAKRWGNLGQILGLGFGGGRRWG
jgi:hypothetical protein